MVSDFQFLLAQTQQAKPGFDLLFMVGLFAIMIGFMYVFTIRPQKIREKKHLEEVAKLKKGDEVILEGGIYGSIHAVEGECMMVKIAEKCVIKIHQRSVRVIMPDAAVKNVESVKQEK